MAGELTRTRCSNLGRCLRNLARCMQSPPLCERTCKIIKVLRVCNNSSNNSADCGAEFENLAMTILGVERNTDKKPNPMREQIPTLIRKLIWTFHKKTIGRAVKAKSQKADDTDFVN